MSSFIATSDLFRWSDQAILLWGSIATILLLLGGWLARGSRVMRWLLRMVERLLRRGPPRDTMRVVPKAGQVGWSEGSVSARPANHLGGTWLVTNPMTDIRTDLVVAGVELRVSVLKRLRLDR